MRCRTVLALLVFCLEAQAESPVGLLSMVSGSVEIVRAGQNNSIRARTADLITAGDRVLTGQHSEATFLFCPESRSAKIMEESEVQFEAAGLRVHKGKLSGEHKLPSCLLPAGLSLAGASQIQSGLLRLRGSNLVQLSPSRTNTATLQPHFRWGPVDNATVFDLKLMDREERVLWSQSIFSTEARYPDSAPSLAWNQKYWWRVTARDGEEVLTETGSYFQVLPQEQADQVHSAEESLRRVLRENPGDNTPFYLLAFLYDENGMLDEAARLYGQIIQSTEPQEWVQARLIELMNKLGWVKLEPEYPR